MIKINTQFYKVCGKIISIQSIFDKSGFTKLVIGKII